MKLPALQFLPMLVENTGTMTMSSSRYFPSIITSSSAVMALVVPIAEKYNDWMTNQRKGSYLGMQFIPLPTKDT